MTAPEHRAVDGGFTCDDCGATRQTPLGMARHRDLCRRRSTDDVATDGGSRP